MERKVTGHHIFFFIKAFYDFHIEYLAAYIVNIQKGKKLLRCVWGVGGHINGL